jgi:predicted dehydrogenase
MPDSRTDSPGQTTQDQFIEAIVNGTETPTSFRAGVAALMLAEAMREASTNRTWIEMPSEYIDLVEPAAEAVAARSPLND